MAKKAATPTGPQTAAELVKALRDGGFVPVTNGSDYLKWDLSKSSDLDTALTAWTNNEFVLGEVVEFTAVINKIGKSRSGDYSLISVSAGDTGITSILPSGVKSDEDLKGIRPGGNLKGKALKAKAKGIMITSIYEKDGVTFIRAKRVEENEYVVTTCWLSSYFESETLQLMDALKGAQTEIAALKQNKK